MEHALKRVSISASAPASTFWKSITRSGCAGVSSGKGTLGYGPGSNGGRLEADCVLSTDGDMMGGGMRGVGIDERVVGSSVRRVDAGSAE